MRIAVDARTIYDEEHRGIGKYAIELYRTLARIRPQWNFTLYHAEEAKAHQSYFAQQQNIRAVRLKMRGDRFRLWHRVALPWALRTEKHDLFHTPSGITPWWIPVPCVATIHDLIPWETKRTDAPALAWMANIKRTIRKSKAIITDSHYTKERLLLFSNVPPEKIHVVPLAAISAPATQPTAERVASLRERCHLKPTQSGFVLHYGMADPRKGTKILIEAWLRLPPELRAEFRLVIVGLSAKARLGFEDQAGKIGFPEENDFGGVTFFEYLAEEDVRDLLSLAMVLAYPTQLEGFGLPVLDGFAAGVPVLTGKSSSLPEVAGDAAQLVDVTDADAVAQGLALLLRSAELRTTMVALGRNRIGSYSWERTAELTAKVMEWNSSEPNRAGI